MTHATSIINSYGYYYDYCFHACLLLIHFHHSLSESYFWQVSFNQDVVLSFFSFPPHFFPSSIVDNPTKTNLIFSNGSWSNFQFSLNRTHSCPGVGWMEIVKVFYLYRYDARYTMVNKCNGHFSFCQSHSISTASIITQPHQPAHRHGWLLQENNYYKVQTLHYTTPTSNPRNLSKVKSAFPTKSNLPFLHKEQGICTDHVHLGFNCFLKPTKNWIQTNSDFSWNSVQNL